MTNYYSDMINQYTILFAVFILILVLLYIGFISFGYGKIKDQMWKTNLALKIMPLDYIPKERLPELKAFFMY